MASDMEFRGDTILVVDDERSMREMLAIVLQERATVCCSPREDVRR